MGRKRQAADLYVSMNGQNVGILTRASTGRLEFTYSEPWLESNARRPISLSMPLTDLPFAGVVVENFFDNLLPDSEQIRKRIQAKFGIMTNTCFDLLWHIGRDCVGALQLTSEPVSMAVQKIEARPLNDSHIADILKNIRSMPLGMDDDDDFRISIAGAQEKTALLSLNGYWHLPLGTTPTSHIFKLPIGHIEHNGLDLSDSVENEWLCCQILKEYGFPVADAEIKAFDGVKALVVKRFDRRWTKDRSRLLRLPQEDMCQALGCSSALKYENHGGPGIIKIMNFLANSANARYDQENFMSANFLYWLLAATDGHSKNFSVYLRTNGIFQLAPFYDIISAHPLMAKKQLIPRKIKMAMALHGKNKHYDWGRILYSHWLSTARLCNFQVDAMAKSIKRILEQMDTVISHVSDRLPGTFPADIAEAIFDGMRATRDRISQPTPPNTAVSRETIFRLVL